MSWTTPVTTFAVHDVLTAAEMNAIGANLAFLHSGTLAKTETTASSASTTGTTELVIASLAFTADGTTSVELDFTAVGIFKTVATDVFNVLLYDGSTAGSGTALAGWNTGNVGTGSAGVYVRKILTPAVGAHTYTALLVRSSGTGTASCYAQTGPPSEPSILAVKMAS
jgi:hypothetical protein